MLVRVAVILHHRHLARPQRVQLRRRGVPLVHEHHLAPGGGGQGRVEILAQIQRRAGQRLFEKRMAARAHAARARIAAHRQQGRATQGAPGLLHRQRPRHMAKAQTGIRVNAKDELGGHMRGSLAGLPGDGEPLCDCGGSQEGGMLGAPSRSSP